ncbi:MAG: S8 family serine peptidase [Planctomycetes bacterium]|nr:S8 family serine peptidase [Planctomycetota bacterium]
MKTLIKIRNLLGMLALAAIIPSALQAQAKPTIFGTPTLDRSAAGPIEPGTEPAVSKIAELAVEGLDWQAQAQAAGMLVKDEGVLLEINAPAWEMPTLNGQLRELGVVPLESGAQNMCRIWVHPGNVSLVQKAVIHTPGADLHAYRAPVANTFGRIDSEGIKAMRTDLYEAAGLNGQGVHIAVLDIGFNGVDGEESNLADADMAGYVPKPGEGSHGTAMVEVIHDIAPAALVSIYRIDEDLDVYTATRNALENGADVIVCALSWFELPGRGIASDAARMATAEGALWVNAAGNFADGGYYENEGLGTTTVDDSEFVVFDSRSNDYMQFISGWVRGQSVTLHFDQDWSSDATLDARLALEVYSWDGMSGTFTLVAGGNPEMQHQVVGLVPEAGMYYFPMIRIDQAGEIGRFRMFSPDADLYYNSAVGSLANPAAVPEVISVGAVDAGDYSDGGAPAGYSSQGGGIFGLTLDLCGPTNVTTGTYGSQGFSGTSAAAAHVAGLLALQLQDPMLKNDPVNLMRFTDIGAQGEDAESGRGLAMANVDDLEPDNQPDGAVELISGVTDTEHSLSPSSDIDWFYFELAEAQSVDISLDKESNLYLYSEDLNKLDEVFGSKLRETVLPVGLYYVAVVRTDATLSDATLEPAYSITLDAYAGAPDTVTDLTAARDQDVFTFTWTEVEGLGTVRYELQVAADPNFEKVLFDQNLARTSIDVALSDSTGTVYARVFSINEFGTSAASDVLIFEASDAQLLNSGGSDSDRIVSLSILAAPEAPAGQGEDEAAGCVGTGAGNGLTLLLLALFGAAVSLKVLSVRGRKEVIAD